MDNETTNNNRLKRINALYDITAEANHSSSTGCPLKRSDSASNIHLHLLQNEKSVSLSPKSKEKLKKKLAEVNNNVLKNENDLLVPKVEVQAYTAIVVSDREQGINNKEKTESIGSKEQGGSGNNPDRLHHSHHKHHHKHRRRSKNDEREALDDGNECREKNHSKRSSKDPERPKNQDAEADYDKKERKSHRQSQQKVHHRKSSKETEDNEREHSHRFNDENLLSNHSERRSSELNNEYETGGEKYSPNLRRSHYLHRKSKEPESYQNKGRSSFNRITDKHLISEHRHTEDSDKELKGRKEAVENEDGNHHYRKIHGHNNARDSEISNGSYHPKSKIESPVTNHNVKDNRHHDSKHKGEANRASKDRRHHVHPRTFDETAEENFLVKRYIEASLVKSEFPKTAESDLEPINVRNKSHSKNKRISLPTSSNKHNSKSSSKNRSKKRSKSLKDSKQIRKKSKEIQTAEPIFQSVQELLLDTTKEKSNKKKSSGDPSTPDLNYNIKVPRADLNNDLTTTAEKERPRLPSYVFKPIDEKVKQEYHAFHLAQAGAKPNPAKNSSTRSKGKGKKAKVKEKESTGPEEETRVESSEDSSRGLKSATTGGGDGVNLQPMAVVEVGRDSDASRSPSNSASGNQGGQGTSETSYTKTSYDSKNDSYYTSKGSEKKSQKSSSSGIGTSSCNSSSNDKPLLSMTDKGAIRFQLPGRIQHKTTIKLAHYPENSEETVIVNVPNEDSNGDDCSKKQSDEAGNLQQSDQCGQPYDPYGFYSAQGQQNYPMNQGQQYMQQMQMQAMQQQQSQSLYSYNCYNPYNPYSYGCGFPPC